MPVKTNSVRCKIFQIECKKMHILHFLGLFVVIYVCKILGFKNPDNVKEITNMRHGCVLLLLWASTLAAFCRPLLSVVDGGRGRASHWRKPQRGKEQQHLFHRQHQKVHCHQQHQDYQHKQHCSGKNCMEEEWRKKAMSMTQLPPAASPWALPGWFSHPSPLCRLKSRWYGSNLEPVF